MFKLKSTGKRINPHASFVDANGTKHSQIPLSLIEEVADPQPPTDYSEDTYYRTEQDDAPYVVYTQKSAQQIAEIMMLRAKQQRSQDVANIKVTTLAGNEFDGDEDAQGRMARAIVALDDLDTIPWVLSNNSVLVVGKAELREALRLAGAAMAAIWVAVYA